MKYLKSEDNRYRVRFMVATEKLMDRLTVKEFISYLEKNAELEDDEDWEYIGGKVVKCKVYDLKEENSNLHKDFLVTEDGRLFYGLSLNQRIELVDKEEVNEGTKEIEVLVKRYQMSPNDDLFQEILESSKYIIYNRATSYRESIPGSEMDDLISEGYMALWKAVQTFRETKGCKFSTYLYSCLNQRYNTLYRTSLAKKRCVENELFSLNSALDDEGKWNPDRNKLFSSGDCDDFVYIELIDTISSMNLSEREKEVINYLLLGYDKPAIGRILEISAPAVHSYVRRIGKKLLNEGIGGRL